MNEWELERRWSIDTGEGRPRDATTRELCGKGVCCLLGPAGSGKTFELRRLARLESPDAGDGRVVRMAAYAESSDQLVRMLDSRLKDGADAVYLDALDEALARNQWIDQALAEWIRARGGRRPRLRISCRSTAWPSAIADAARAVYGEESVAVARMEPLDDSNLQGVARSEGVDSSAFMNEVRRSNSMALAALPLTLSLMLRLFRDGDRLPASRMELFERAVSSLASDQAERRERGTASRLDHAAVLQAAERLACYTILSGRDAIDLGDGASDPSAWNWRDLGTFDGTMASEEVMREISRCGLSEADGPRRFRFIHRQIAEYLTGRTLARLPAHQAKALLASSPGWESGVAGPLRETAAFAAMGNEALARWLAERDPEVVGLSDVANRELRRMATLGLLDRFRRRELTDHQVSWDGFPCLGLRYDGMEDDLLGVLRERGPDDDDVLDFAIHLVRKLDLSALHDVLADLALDRSAPLQAREFSGRVVAESAGRAVKRRLKPLIHDSADDPDQELKGSALRCCWPEDLSTRELLPALTPRTNRSLMGSYGFFLHELSGSGFQAADDRVAGLRWAADRLDRDSKFEDLNKHAWVIAAGALSRLDDPKVGAALADLLLKASDGESLSLFDDAVPAITGDPTVRRRLMGYLAERAKKDDRVNWWLFSDHGLIRVDDFAWLLERAVDEDLSEVERKNHAECARFCFDTSSFESVEAWRRYRGIEPVKSTLDYPPYTDPDSEEDRRLRKWHRQETRPRTTGRSTDVPPIQERVRDLLDRGEQEDPLWFLNLATWMWRPDSHSSHESPRLLRQTPGWAAADPETRRRIVRAARRLLNAPTDAPERLRATNEGPRHGFLAAVWLLMEEDDSWSGEVGADWWERWCWLLLKDCRIHFAGEPIEPRRRLFAVLHQRAPRTVRDVVIEFLLSADGGSWNVASGPLEVFENVPDPEFDGELADRLERDEFGIDLVRRIVPFLLRRAPGLALPYCRRRLTAKPGAIPDDVLVAIAATLLDHGSFESFSSALSFLDVRADVAKDVLRAFATCRGGPGSGGLDQAGADQIGALVAILMREYPPDTDPKHEGAYSASPDDNAIQLRSQLISWLGSQASREAVDALTALEREFGAKDPWLRRPRSQAQQAYRRSHWAPIPPRAVARMLDDRKGRLIRDERDAVGGIVEAIEGYERELRLDDGPSDLEDLWNTPKGSSPTPKEEEHVSKKLCEAVRRYFRDYAVAADREVQIFRRAVPPRFGGAPSSEVDVLVSVSASGTGVGGPIKVPIEVKKSDNSEAKTGLKDQLVDRYMRELGVSRGVFVVVWFDAPNLAKSHGPKWKDVEQAKEDLRRRAGEDGDEATVEVVVVDASLR